MARIKGPVYRISRRLGFSVLETGEELQKRAYPPGQHGASRRTKLSNYAMQLREKQKLRYLYGVNEKQFHNTFMKAKKSRGVVGHNFLFILESRLDNLVYRMGFARTRRQARQLVTHGHILVNGKKVDIPSSIIKVGSTIELKDKSKKLDIIRDALEATMHTMPFVKVDAKSRKGEYLRLPERSELNQDINELLVVEYYNRLS